MSELITAREYSKTPFVREYVMRRHGDKAKGGEQWHGKELAKDEISPEGYREAGYRGAAFEKNLKQNKPTSNSNPRKNQLN